MKNVSFISMLFFTVTATAQSIDSTKAKPTNSLSKYQQPSQYGAQSAPAPAPNAQPNLNLKKTDEKRINSNYQYENGRITGGKTSLKLGKKKD